MIRVFLTDGSELKLYRISLNELHLRFNHALEINSVMEPELNIFINPYAIAWYKETA